MNIDLLLQATEKELPVSRFKHTLRVLQTALDLAKAMPIDKTALQVAAVLHDYCKFWKPDKLIDWIERHRLPSDLLHYNHELWHAPVGAEVAREKFAIIDEDTLNAIRYHTTGRPEMSVLEKIIFLADVIEPGRRYPGVEQVREFAQYDLNRAILQSLDNTIIYLLESSQKVYPLTLAARNRLIDIVFLNNSKEE